ncbi:hypothetical protein [Ruminobacter sp.]
MPKFLLDKGRFITGIGHCAVGYIDGDMPEAAKRKDGRVFWAE